MPYSDFTIPELKKRFGLSINEETNLFNHIAEVEIPATLADILRRWLSLSLNLNTEKARSELIIAPMLTEFKLLYSDKVSLFSGIEFDVDDAAGLRGRCDYILSRSPEQLALTAPVCVLVEAKNENIVAGIPQCLAEMLAAAKFNQSEGIPPFPVYGAVTTGILWRFLKMCEGIAYVDSAEYTIYMPMKIFAILTHIVINDRI
ncbi:MAG: hypothetical protein BWK80_29705 [Desulfobacteraceae bacterium IS3]|nr:MAG: hypothetical protein BWK80_29705 [Desulfobacteraceae bacterium IS3]